MKRRGAVLLFAVVAAVGLYMVPAGATGRHHHDGVLVVDNQPRHHRSCLGTRDPFDTIQGAVNAAGSSDTIRVCPGTYTETVKVQKPDLTILGANAGRDATAHGRGRESIVTNIDAKGTVQLLEDDITWDGFTIRGVPKVQNGPGMYTSPTHSGYLVRDTIFLDNGFGLHLGSNGKHPTLVCRNRFTANNEFEDPAGANGIYSDEGAQQVLITSNLFEGHNGAAVFFADKGKLQRDVLIESNKSSTTCHSRRSSTAPGSASPPTGSRPGSAMSSSRGRRRRSSSAPATTTSWSRRTRSSRPAAMASTSPTPVREAPGRCRPRT